MRTRSSRRPCTLMLGDHRGENRDCNRQLLPAQVLLPVPSFPRDFQFALWCRRCHRCPVEVQASYTRQRRRPSLPSPTAVIEGTHSRSWCKHPAGPQGSSEPGACRASLRSRPWCWWKGCGRESRCHSRLTPSDVMKGFRYGKGKLSVDRRVVACLSPWHLGCMYCASGHCRVFGAMKFNRRGLRTSLRAQAYKWRVDRLSTCRTVLHRGRLEMRSPSIVQLDLTSDAMDTSKCAVPERSAMSP